MTKQMKTILIFLVYIIMFNINNSYIFSQDIRSDCDRINRINNTIGQIKYLEFKKDSAKLNLDIKTIIKILDSLDRSTKEQINAYEYTRLLWENSIIDTKKRHAAEGQIEEIINRLLIPLHDLEFAFCYGYDSEGDKKIKAKLQTSIENADAKISTNQILLNTLTKNLAGNVTEIKNKIDEVCSGSSGGSSQAVNLKELTSKVQLILDEVIHTNNPRTLRVLLDAMSTTIEKIDKTMINMDNNLGSLKKNIENIDATITLMKTSINNIEGQTTKIAKWVDMNQATTVLLGGSIMGNGGVGVHLSCLGSIISNDINWLEIGLDATSLPTYNVNEPFYGGHLGFLIKDRVLTSLRGFAPRNRGKFGNMFTVSVSIKTGINFFVGGQYSYVSGLGLTLLAGI